MITKGDPPVALLTGRSTLTLLTVYFEFNQLKQLFRQGWLRRGVSSDQCETVAEHTFSMAILALIIADAYFSELDLLKVLTLVLLHDFGEIGAGDIVPADGIDPDEKCARECESVLQTFGKLPTGHRYMILWDEYEAGVSPEARFVKQIDRLDMALQACVYHLRGFIDAKEFLDAAERIMKEPVMQIVLAEIKQLTQAPENLGP